MWDGFLGKSHPRPSGTPSRERVYTSSKEEVSAKLTEVGEYVFPPIIPLANLDISPVRFYNQING